ncbi:unnamed protein product [Soboliphyme baturini]|uniref:Aromatic-L-amino-acid decarboxylase n=1 Tax=Soboliphyme baturini TaxID=241478 RepID=A0A183IAA0_9BILA|nr:unnamed protein product [Soboliphyme baturini]
MQPGLDTEKFRQWGKRMVDIVADYWASLPSRDPESAVRPGYMRSLLPAEAPEEPESWEKIIADIEPVIMSGSTHWHHPRFFAYFPTGISYPSVIADILSGGIGCMGFTWTSNPSCTELEMIMMDWLAKLLKLPEYFLFTHPGPGGGMIQSAASECTLFTLLAAKKTALDSHMAQDGSCQLSRDKLVAYCSDQVSRKNFVNDVIIITVHVSKKNEFSFQGS